MNISDFNNRVLDALKDKLNLPQAFIDSVKNGVVSVLTDTCQYLTEIKCVLNNRLDKNSNITIAIRDCESNGKYNNYYITGVIEVKPNELFQIEYNKGGIIHTVHVLNKLFPELGEVEVEPMPQPDISELPSGPSPVPPATNPDQGNNQGGGSTKPPVTNPDTTQPVVKKKIIHFNANGGTGAMSDVETPLGKWTVPDNAFTSPANKQFKTWSETANGSKPKVVGSQITFGTEGEYTLYAIWEDVPIQPAPKKIRKQSVTFGADISAASFNKYFNVGNTYFNNVNGCVGKLTARKAKVAELELITDGKQFTGGEFHTNNGPAGFITAKNGNVATVKLLDSKIPLTRQGSIVNGKQPYTPVSVGTVTSDGHQDVTLGGSFFEVGQFISQGNIAKFSSNVVSAVTEVNA